MTPPVRNSAEGPASTDMGGEMVSKHTPLGMVMHEPLSSILKSERAPPPIFVGASNAGSNADAQSGPNRPVVSRRQKLTEAEFRFELSKLAIELEPAVANCGDHKVQNGFDEVCNFLNHCEHLRILQQN